MDYFYKDAITISQDNVCALLALSRQLLVAPVCQYCSEFVAQQLTTGNCIAYLRQVRVVVAHTCRAQGCALAPNWHIDTCNGRLSGPSGVCPLHDSQSSGVCPLALTPMALQQPLVQLPACSLYAHSLSTEHSTLTHAMGG